MNKTELINVMAEQSSMSKVEAKKALEATLKGLANALEQKEKIALIGFGTFSISERAARTGINPSTKQKIEIPAKNIIKFKAGMELTEAVNK